MTIRRTVCGAALPAGATGTRATYLQGLLSDVERKNAETIAYRHDEDRQGLQTFIGTAPWDHRPLLDELARQVGRELGEPDGVDRFRSVGVPQEGEAFGGRGAAVVRTVGKDRELPGGNLHGLRLAEGTRPGGRCGCTFRRSGRRIVAAARNAGFPRNCAIQTRHEMVLEMLENQGAFVAARLDRRGR